MKTILIIGMGEFGMHLAKKLLKLKNEVCIVDQDKEVINLLSDEFTNAYIGDCMKDATLEDLGVENFDICIVAIGENFQASLEITSRLKDHGAKYILSKASSEIQAKFLKLAGADETIYPEKDMAEKVALKCNMTNMVDFIQISEEYSIFEMKVTDEWISKSIKELNIRNKYNINIIAIRNNRKITIPNPSYVFQAEDIVFFFASTNIVNKFKESSSIKKRTFPKRKTNLKNN